MQDFERNWIVVGKPFNKIESFKVISGKGKEKANKGQRKSKKRKAEMTDFADKDEDGATGCAENVRRSERKKNRIDYRSFDEDNCMNVAEETQQPTFFGKFIRHKWTGTSEEDGTEHARWYRASCWCS